MTKLTVAFQNFASAYKKHVKTDYVMNWEIWREEIMVHLKLVRQPVLKKQSGFRSGACVAKGVCSLLCLLLQTGWYALLYSAKCRGL